MVRGCCCNLKKIKETLDADLSKAHPPQGLSTAEKKERDAVRAPLITRAYHLPKHSWHQDWWQYMTNNHPVFGIFLHHRFHPVGTTVRVLSLVGSCLFGLAVTNIIYMAFVFSDQDYDKTYITVNSTAPSVTGVPDIDAASVSALSVTNGNIALWTLGAALHALYDNTIWALAACTCCVTAGNSAEDNGGKQRERRIQRYQSTGTFLVLVSVVLVTAVATFAVALRAALNSNDGTVEVANVDSYGLADDEVELWKVNGANDFEFVIAYLVELGLNFFVYYPIVGSILFFGVLTCGRYPVLGGRSYEMKQLMESKSHQQEVEVTLEEGNGIEQAQASGK